MSIEGLMIPQQTPEVQKYIPGIPDIDEAVGVTLEAYKILGFAGDAEAAEQSLKDAFQALVSLGLDGRLYVQAPEEITFVQIIEAAEAKKPNNVEEMFTYHELWTPGTEEKSYTEAELNSGPAKPIAQLALFNAQADPDIADPMLYHLGLPFDDYANQAWHKGEYDTTQLAEIDKSQQEFEADNSEFMLRPSDQRDSALFVLMDRIRGTDPEELVLDRGFMRIPKLGRRTVGGRSFVGGVSSYDGRLGLGGSGGDAGSYGGVGLSAEQKEA